MRDLRRIFASRQLLLVIAALLAAALWAPLWRTKMESPQYHGDEALTVSVYAGRLTGDIHEIQTLNKYIGVRMPEHLPELRAVPYAIGFMVALALVCFFLPAGIRKKALIGLFVLMLLFLAASAVLLQYRLYVMGHDRGKAVLSRIDDFTPLFLGTTHVGNFHVQASLQAGGWAIVLAFVLTACFSFMRNAERRVTA